MKKRYNTIEGGQTTTTHWSTSLPTEKQKNTIIFLSQLFSNLLQPVWLFRFDPLNKSIFIIAGKEESLEIIIFENGQWEFSENE
ncbi:MAG: hypothetical protein QNJ42_19855 [Crocosphaera sp.]|nr:hypothetical protein [Crocosphaera sp.]